MSSALQERQLIKMRLRTWPIKFNTHNSKWYLQGPQLSEVVENSSWQACQCIVT